MTGTVTSGVSRIKDFLLLLAFFLLVEDLLALTIIGLRECFGDITFFPQKLGSQFSLLSTLSDLLYFVVCDVMRIVSFNSDANDFLLLILLFESIITIFRKIIDNKIK